MSKKLYSAEEVAERLGLHVRTVRGYLRDGRLNAVRIGKQYRITHEDLEAFVGAAVTDESEVRRTRHVEVSSVVEIDAVSPHTASRISTLLMATSAHPGENLLRVSTAYDEERGKMKIIIFGEPAETARLLDSVEAVLRS
ncbi:helix-turn-helix domain-containing protein [Amycolatopsis sp. K13G38]|uniref:Helix-turn-helix domain-containing protein n=1 Tax=Amycolatopsis acididurans TaxID=2724524 RepID=A0ABX1JC76_9PSEU|nr:helix-turn-helix domain-containing protein [Amycolatopsis acididurans]NKQ57278.1 helix-turn-helix domain-containing protein [Amycolatopsis acididurans]